MQQAGAHVLSPSPVARARLERRQALVDTRNGNRNRHSCAGGARQAAMAIVCDNSRQGVSTRDTVHMRLPPRACRASAYRAADHNCRNRPGRRATRQRRLDSYGPAGWPGAPAAGRARAAWRRRRAAAAGRRPGAVAAARRGAQRAAAASAAGGAAAARAARAALAAARRSASPARTRRSSPQSHSLHIQKPNRHTSRHANRHPTTCLPAAWQPPRTVHVVHVAVAVVVPSRRAARLGIVDPQAGCDVGVVRVEARVEHRHDDLLRAYVRRRVTTKEEKARKTEEPQSSTGTTTGSQPYPAA
jgi:hypothetical protein